MSVSLDLPQVSEHRLPFPSADRRRIAVCFFGITRSLQHTIGSINQNIFYPARRCGEVRVFAHLFSQLSIDNPRSGEFGKLDPCEYRLLNADQLEFEEPSTCLNAMRFQDHLLLPDPWEDGYRSIRNLFHQLHSLGRVTSLASGWQPDIYVFARPDLRYLDSFEPFLLQALDVRRQTVFFPNWQHHGGMNDRFALVVGQDAASVYGNRARRLSEFRFKFGGIFNGERLLKYAILGSRINSEPIYARAERVRNSGKKRDESFRRPSTFLNKTKIRFVLKVGEKDFPC